MVRFCLGRFKTTRLKQPRLAGTCRRKGRVAGLPGLEGAIVATFGLKYSEGFGRRPEAIFNHEFVARMHRGRSWGKEEQPEPVMGRTDLIVAEQIDFRIVEGDEGQLVSSDAQLHLPRQLNCPLLHVGFHFGPGDAPIGVGIHGSALASRPLFEKRQVDLEVGVAGSNGEEHAVLDIGGKQIMSHRQMRQANHEAGEQQPSRPGDDSPGA